MKVLLSNETYVVNRNPSNPCRECKVNNEMCLKIPVEFGKKYGGFLPSNTKIFIL